MSPLTAWAQPDVEFERLDEINTIWDEGVPLEALMISSKRPGPQVFFDKVLVRSEDGRLSFVGVDDNGRVLPESEVKTRVSELRAQRRARDGVLDRQSAEILAAIPDIWDGEYLTFVAYPYVATPTLPFADPNGTGDDWGGLAAEFGDYYTQLQEAHASADADLDITLKDPNGDLISTNSYSFLQTYEGFEFAATSTGVYTIGLRRWFMDSCNGSTGEYVGLAYHVEN